MTIKVFTDLHHGDLFHSLQLLFEDRLGYELYRPIGWDWFTEGYWKIGDPYPNPADTARQYLSIRKGGWKAYVNMNGNPPIEDNIHYVWNPFHKRNERAVTLAKFKEMEFDIIMPTFPQHDVVYKDLRDKFQPKAKLLSQIGNINQKTIAPNVLYSVPYSSKIGQHSCFYHQEINPDVYFYEPPPQGTKRIFSMVNLLPYPEIYHQYKNGMKDIDFRAYGSGCPNGALSGSRKVAEKMREANLGWHVRWNEAYGHTAMGWGASGRTVIIRSTTLRRVAPPAIPLFVPGVNCIDIDAHTVHENHMLIRRALDPSNQVIMSEIALDQFRKAINYDADAERVKRFLERLI